MRKQELTRIFHGFATLSALERQARVQKCTNAFALPAVFEEDRARFESEGWKIVKGTASDARECNKHWQIAVRLSMTCPARLIYG